MGEMRRGEAWEEQRLVRDRYTSTLVIAGPITAAVRLAKEPDVSNRGHLRVCSAPQPSPRASHRRKGNRYHLPFGGSETISRLTGHT
jgi:hypothetical protein